MIWTGNNEILYVEDRNGTLKNWLHFDGDLGLLRGVNEQNMLKNGKFGSPFRLLASSDMFQSFGWGYI